MCGWSRPIEASYGRRSSRRCRPPPAINVLAARIPDSIAGRIPSPLSGYASPAASPINKRPSAITDCSPTPAARYACPRQGSRHAPGAFPVPSRNEMKSVRCAVKFALLRRPIPTFRDLTFPDAPAVTVEIAAEEELGHVRSDRRVMPIQVKFHLLRHDWPSGGATIANTACDRTEMTAGADHDRRPDLLIGHPRAAVAAE